MKRTVDVFADWVGLGGPTRLGDLRIDQVRGKEHYSLRLDAEWLDRRPLPRLLDPALDWVRGDQHAAGNFGMLLDSAPDRWGRSLIARREARQARLENRSPRRLTDADFLLAVNDHTRMGGLRFRDPQSENFLDPSTTDPVPPLRLLRELESAAIRLEREEGSSLEQAEVLRLLLAPGSSLGGARPKANVVDPAGNLWIAKFPSPKDEVDVGAWEGLAHALAKRVGLQVPVARVERFSAAGHTFLSRRFDRIGGGRVHYASAMTLLGYQDGDGADTGAGYLDLAELICRIGESVEVDLRELWTRIAFSVAVSNGDDHLRNHGFLLGEKGWTLSPMFDVNPQPWASGLSLNISESDNALDMGLVREVAPFFRIKDAEATVILKSIRKVVASWESIARDLPVPAAERERMRQAFAAKPV